MSTVNSIFNEDGNLVPHIGMNRDETVKGVKL